MAEPASVKPPEHTPMDVDVPMRGPRPIEPLPILPLSPVSNPASPTYRKRHRPVDWDPPDHVPEFLPPFPTMEDAPPSPQAEVMPEPIQQQQQAAPAEALTSLAGADWLMPVPYNQSSLASQPEFHLPAHLPLPEPREPKLPTPKADQALIGAYHHVLTHRQSTNTTANGNPLRHKVAMALLSLAQNTPRWDVPDTLFSNMTSNQARVTAMGPAHPIALGDSHGAQVMKNNKDFKFPTVTQRTVVAPDKLTSVVSQPSSRLPDLSKLVLPVRLLPQYDHFAGVHCLSSLKYMRAPPVWHIHLCSSQTTNRSLTGKVYLRHGIWGQSRRTRRTTRRVCCPTPGCLRHGRASPKIIGSRSREIDHGRRHLRSRPRPPENRDGEEPIERTTFIAHWRGSISTLLILLLSCVVMLLYCYYIVSFVVIREATTSLEFLEV